MKKLLSLMLAAALFIAVAVLPASAEESPAAGFMYGDVNADGAVTAGDALLVLQMAVGKVTLEANMRTLANVDAKGFVTAADALMVLQKSVGKIESFAAEQNTAVTASPYTDEMSVVQKTDEIAIDGPITNIQDEATFTPNLNLPVDSVMAYVRSSVQVGISLKAWSEANLEGKTIDCMIAINRSFNGEYYNMYPDRAVGTAKDSQTRKNGSIINHAADGDYMVPTESFIEYKWEIIKQILQYDVSYIAFEEPELFQAAGYSVGFKEEWVKYYGTPWEDQTSSADALYKTSKLKVYLFERAITTLADRIHEVKPNVKIVLASHCSMNYINHTICSSIATLSDLDCVDGIIGQTWSDSAKFNLYRDGEAFTDGFIESYIEYGTYPDLARDDQWMFALSDSAADGAAGWSDHEIWYKKTIVSQLMLSDINRFEFIWPSRGFAGAPRTYKIQQLNTLTAQIEMAGKATELYAGTSGIYFAQSDSETWVYGTKYMPVSNATKGINGLTVPLVEKGVPLKGISLEQVNSVDDLKDVKTLILTYDIMKPDNEAVNTAIAEWVKAGGQLLYMGGHDGFENIESGWWSKNSSTPLEDLLKKLGLSSISVGSDAAAAENCFSYSGAAGYISSVEGLSLSENMAKYTATFSGSGFTPIIKQGESNIGVTAKAGSGNITLIGLPSAYYAETAGGAQLMRDITEYSLLLYGNPYIESDTMVIKRGDYVISQLLTDGSKVLNGKYVNLFDPDLPMLTDPELTDHASMLYKEVSQLMTGTTPRLLFSGGVKSDISETESTMSYTVSSPASCRVVARIALNGKTLDSVTVNVGSKKIEATYEIDEATGTVMIWYLGSTGPATVTINWK